MRGVFARTGEEIAHLGRADGSEVKIALSQEAEPHFRAAVQRAVRVRVEGRGVLDATLARVESRATREIIHPALTALSGGPLALRRSEEPADRDAPDAGYELAEPHYVAIASLAPGTAPCPGERARVKLRSARDATLWTELQGTLARWLKRYAAQ